MPLAMSALCQSCSLECTVSVTAAEAEIGPYYLRAFIQVPPSWVHVTGSNRVWRHPAPRTPPRTVRQRW